MAPAIEAMDPLTMNDIPDDDEDAGNSSLMSADASHWNDEIPADRIKCEPVSVLNSIEMTQSQTLSIINV